MMRNADLGIRTAELSASAKRNRCAITFPLSAFRLTLSVASAADAPGSPFGRRAAMTLIELLIVIVILATLTAAALPILTPSTTERRVREATRGLNAYISQAQAKAISSQRPYGVALKRLSSETGQDAARGVCIEVVAVEQPVPYSGFDENSRMRVAINPDQPGSVRLQFVTRNSTNTSTGLPAGWGPDLVPAGLIRVNDIVEFQGSRFQLATFESGTTIDANNYFTGNAADSTPQLVTLIAAPINDTGQLLKPEYDANGQRLSAALIQTGNSTPPYWTEPAAYKIHRQPTTTSAPPFQLPEGTAIDLEASGEFGEVPLHWDDQNAALGELETPTNSPIYIMFSPEGSIERVQYERAEIDSGTIAPVSVLRTPTANVALLVGRRENIPVTTLNPVGGTETELEAEKAKINWLNTESRWVVLGAQTGNVVTAENAFVNLPIQADDYDGDNDVDGSLLETRMGQIQAAQEFARGMRPTGGG